MRSFMRANPADPSVQPPRHERLKAYRSLAREMQYSVDPPTDAEIETMFDLTVKYVDSLVPRYNETMDLLAMAVPKETAQVLAAVMMIDLCEATFTKLKRHFAQFAAMNLQNAVADMGVPPEVKEVMRAMGLSDAEIADFLDMLQDKPNDG